MTTTVRQASADSAEDVAALAAVRFAWRHDDRGEQGDLGVFTPALGERWREHAATHRAWLAEVDRVAVGMAWLGTVHRIPGPERFHRFAGMVQSVYVRPQHRGRGIGAELVAAIVAYAGEHGFGYLMVHPTQRSYPVYERAGFGATPAVLELGLTEPRRPAE